MTTYLVLHKYVRTKFVYFLFHFQLDLDRAGDDDSDAEYAKGNCSVISEAEEEEELPDQEDVLIISESTSDGNAPFVITQEALAKGLEVVITAEIGDFDGDLNGEKEADTVNLLFHFAPI